MFKFLLVLSMFYSVLYFNSISNLDINYWIMIQSHQLYEMFDKTYIFLILFSYFGHFLFLITLLVYIHIYVFGERERVKESEMYTYLHFNYHTEVRGAPSDFRTFLIGEVEPSPNINNEFTQKNSIELQIMIMLD